MFHSLDGFRHRSNLCLDPGSLAACREWAEKIYNGEFEAVRLSGDLGFFDVDQGADHPDFGTILPGHGGETLETAGKKKVHQGCFDDVVQMVPEA